MTNRHLRDALPTQRDQKQPKGGKSWHKAISPNAVCGERFCKRPRIPNKHHDSDLTLQHATILLLTSALSLARWVLLDARLVYGVWAGAWRRELGSLHVGR